VLGSRESEVVMAKQKWSDLSERTRRLIVVAGVAEAASR